MATTMPPLAVPSSFAKIMPVQLTISEKVPCCPPVPLPGTLDKAGRRRKPVEPEPAIVGGGPRSRQLESEFELFDGEMQVPGGVLRGCLSTLGARAIQDRPLIMGLERQLT